MSRLSHGFSAGAVGALANLVFVAIMAALGVTGLFEVELPRPEMPGYLYKQVVWGGLWGFIFLLPVLTGRSVARGLLFGTLPSLVTLLIIFPARTMGQLGPGLFGVNAGPALPALVFAANWIWGLAAAFWHRKMTAPA